MRTRTTNVHVCVETCQANKDFKVKSIAAYDNALKPHAGWFVGYESTVNELIVSLADVRLEDLYVGC